jgi:hypothetical protein
VEEAQVKDEDEASEAHDTVKLEHDNDDIGRDESTVTSGFGTPLEDDVGVYGTEMDILMDEGEEEGVEEEGEEKEGEEEEGEENQEELHVLKEP